MRCVCATGIAGPSARARGSRQQFEHFLVQWEFDPLVGLGCASTPSGAAGRCCPPTDLQCVGYPCAPSEQPQQEQLPQGLSGMASAPFRNASDKLCGDVDRHGACQPQSVPFSSLDRDRLGTAIESSRSNGDQLDRALPSKPLIYIWCGRRDSNPHSLSRSRF